MSGAISVDVAGLVVVLEGESNPVAEAALAALLVCGAVARASGATIAPDILLVSLPLRPDTKVILAPVLDIARAVIAAMALRGEGRVVFILSAIGSLPMRRFPEFSQHMAAAVADMRGLAMEFGPWVQVNAVGLGAIGGTVLTSGSEAQISHTALSRAGTLSEAVGPILFLCDRANSYTTGQVLVVDGGWSAGYGRNF